MVSVRTVIPVPRSSSLGGQSVTLTLPAAQARFAMSSIRPVQARLATVALETGFSVKPVRSLQRVPMERGESGAIVVQRCDNRDASKMRPPSHRLASGVMHLSPWCNRWQWTHRITLVALVALVSETFVSLLAFFALISLS